MLCADDFSARSHLHANAQRKGLRLNWVSEKVFLQQLLGQRLRLNASWYCAICCVLLTRFRRL